MNKYLEIGINDIKDCVFIVKDGVLVDDSLEFVEKIKDIIIYGFSKPCIASLSENFQVIIINRSERYHEREENLEKEFQRKLGIYAPTFYCSTKKTYSNLFQEIKESISIDFERSFLIGSCYDDAVIARKMGFNEIFITKTSVKSLDINERNRLLSLDPMPIFVDSLWDATKCINLAIGYKHNA